MALALLATGQAAGTVSARGGTVFDENAEWHYFKGLTEASSPDPTAWRETDFDDADWLLGPGPFFYEFNSGYTGNTDLTDMRGSYGCVFLRRAFELANPAAVERLTLEIRSDDGCILWLNGREVARVNMAEGEPTFQSTALNASHEPNLATVVVTNQPDLLLPGRNVLAAQAFNASLGGSSDFLFAVSLATEGDEQPPVVAGAIPPAGATVRELASIEVIFDESVTGVDAADLLINGTPATGVEEYSPRDYGFTFASPTPGEVVISWAAAHGITDLAGAANPFAGEGWTYTLDPNAPPANVTISEFLADNDTGLRDADGDRSDWIELRNLGPDPANLEGWFLTDDAANPAKWRFPAVVLRDGEHLLVWASGKDRTDPAAELHTNFKLDAAGEYLALVAPDGRVASEFAPAYPEQRDDISYGRDLLDPTVTGYFETPTPGAPNTPGGPGFAPDPVFNLAPGLYATNRLVIEISAPSGEIYYSANGYEPLTRGAPYTGPITITSSAVLLARVRQDGLLPSRPVSAGYHLVDATLTNFSSNLPLLVVKPARGGIPQDSRTPVHVVSLEPVRGRTTLLGKPEFVGMGQMEIRGQSSTGFPKKQYNLEINDDAGQDLETPLMGLPAESDWVLNGPYSDKSLLNNFLAFELHEKMGHYAVRRRFFELFLDQSRGALRYPTDYRGIYVLLEKIKIDRHRVDVARLTPTTRTEPDITGGYIFKKDKNSPGDINFSTRGGAGFGSQSLKYHDPKPKEITAEQRSWLRNHLIEFERALYATDWLSRTGADHYSHYIDVNSFVDNHWIVEFTKQIDGYRLSNYFHKDRNGPIHMDPIWDWNLSFGNADYLNGWDPRGWYYPLIDANAHIWLRRLISGSTSPSARRGDPDFNQAIIDRWSVLRTNVLAASNVVARIGEIAAYLDEAKEREFSRWPRLNTYVWPNPRNLYVVPTYAQVIANKQQWVRDRFAWIDQQFLAAPTLSLAGGRVSPGTRLAITGPGASILYTLDGSDPRRPGGNIAPGARTYTGPLTLNDTVRVFARARQGSDWSGPAAATFVTQLPALLVSEIMYHPRPPAPGAEFRTGDFEYLELLNTGTAPLPLAGYRFADGIQFDFAEAHVRELAPGGRLLLVRNQAAFESRYGAGLPVAGEFVGALDDAGESVRLVGPMQETVQAFRFENRWYPATGGLGFALVVSGEAAVANGSDAAAWRAGSVLDGTPGQPEPAAPLIPRVLVNEVLAHAVAPETDAIELHNPASQPADISSWYLSDDPLTPKVRLPAGTVIPGHGFLVVAAAQFEPGPARPEGFRLGAGGDDVFLFSADGDGRLTGYLHGFSFGAAAAGVSFGRFQTADGDEQFPPQAAVSLGAANTAPWIGPVVISEVMYHPPDVFVNDAWWDAPENEYVELVNLGDEPALLGGHVGANPWRLRDAVRFTFPAGTRLAPGERLLVVGFDPVNDPHQAAAFRELYGMPADTPLLGPWEGKLDNRAESVELARPVALPGDEEGGTLGEMVVDRVAYRDAAPWPAGADGFGFALQRQPPGAFGNDPAAWQARAPSPGRPADSGEVPRIQMGPRGQAVELGADVTLTVLATGPGPLRHQWRHDGVVLPGANQPALTLANVQPGAAGHYDVLVANATGATVSPPARVRVYRPGIDSDLDGLDDAYEAAQGLDPENPNDAGWDTDGDGLSNRDEFVAGADPSDPDSTLGFDTVQVAGDGGVTLAFRAAGNRAYAIEYRDRLGDGGWQRLREVPPADPPETTRRTVTVQDLTNPPPGERYYRLQARLP